jgi:hypothetical protein
MRLAYHLLYMFYITCGMYEIRRIIPLKAESLLKIEGKGRKEKNDQRLAVHKSIQGWDQGALKDEAGII